MKPPKGMTISPRSRLWCLTHGCWDGDCGVLGQHEVEPRHEVTFDPEFLVYAALLRESHDHAHGCTCRACRRRRDMENPRWMWDPARLDRHLYQSGIHDCDVEGCTAAWEATDGR